MYDTAPHLIPPGHPCVECGVFFSSRSKRERHFDAVHLGLKPFECEHCASTFSEAGDLKKHISAVHLGLKPFVVRALHIGFSLKVKTHKAHGKHPSWARLNYFFGDWVVFRNTG